MAGRADYMAELRAPCGVSAACALVVVDMQRASASRHHGLGASARERGDFDGLAWRFERIESLVVPNLRRLIAAFRARRRPVLHVTLGSAAPDYADIAPHLRAFTRWIGNRVGSEVHAILPEVEPREDETVLRKTTMGAFASTDIEARLRRAAIDSLVVAGVSTSFCVDQTAREAADRGFAVTVVEDAVAENTPAWHRTSLELFARNFGRVASTDAILHEFEETARRLAPATGE